MRRSSWRRQASRSPPSAYRIRRVARRPGGPYRLRATRTSVRCPTTSRPRRIHDRRASSRRSPVDSATAVARPPLKPGGSSTTKSVSECRASAASRPSRSAIRAGLSVAASRPPGRSRTSRSTERPASSAPPMARPSSRVSGVMTTSHSSRMPRATASTGSKLRERSSQATMDPWAWASAASRRTSVVRPLDPSPRIATLAERGRPPGPRMASSAAKPVWMTRSFGSGRGSFRGPTSGSGTNAGSAASASDPMTRGAAAPHRARRPATAASTSA